MISFYSPCIEVNEKRPLKKRSGSKTIIPSEICIDLATKQWDPANDGFIGVAATANDFADVSAAYIDEVFEGRPVGTPYGRQEAISACGATDTASVAFKFY